MSSTAMSALSSRSTRPSEPAHDHVRHASPLAPVAPAATCAAVALVGRARRYWPASRMSQSSRPEERTPWPQECDVAAVPGALPPQSGGTAWRNRDAERETAKERLAALAHTLGQEVIPRLIDAHPAKRLGHAGVTGPAAVPGPAPTDIERFVSQLIQASDGEVAATVRTWHARGLGVDRVFLELLSPAARRLGEMWSNDELDFSSVTICLGRLQRLLREWSPVFGREVQHPANGRRVLLAQHPDEQHSFGLSMLAEFFRREGWEVLGGVGGAVADPSAEASREWFDVVGFSLGSEGRIAWVTERIAQLRQASRNRHVVVMVGGPIVLLQPELVGQVGADGTGPDGLRTPALAESLVASRVTP
jgi:MerR family transcriptional regulator, light-induced transcriptional regulator